MKTLVLNVDRDDDFGRKAKVNSPIIGIKDNLEAANKLGQEDPEDSDLNAIFSAISTYNKLQKENRDVEIATICGNINVGFKSDEILAKQLEQVISQTRTEQVILITDGAEDEYVLPIIESRIKIASVARVTVKQSKELEDTYYRIVKLLDDDKVQKQFILPISLVLIVWSIFVILGLVTFGFGAILLTLGGYLLMRAFRWDRTIAKIWDETKTGFLTGKIAIYTYIIAIVIIVANSILAYNELNTQDFSPGAEFLSTVFFLNYIIWGIVIAGLIAIFGRVIDVYVKDKKAPWNYWFAPFSLLAFGFICSAVFSASLKAFENWPSKFYIEPYLTFNFIFYTISGILIALIGAITYHHIKEMYTTKRKELEIEKQVKKVVNNN